MKNSLFLKITFVSCAFLLSVLSKANIYQVTVTTFAGAGSINQAVIDANTNPGKDTIYFSIPGAGPHTIILGADMVILGDVLIDGSSQTGYNLLAPSPVVELRNSPAMAFIVNGGASDIRTLAINNCALGLVYNTPNNRLSGCYLGLGMDGVTDSGNNGHGIIINPASSGNIIGGTTAAQRNVISGNNNGHGIIGTASNGNYIFGNYFGTNATGTGMVANSFMGIQMDNSSNNTIGGASLDSANIISGNGQNGVQFIGGNANRILGNVIGLQVDKATALGNTGSGVNIINCTNTQIGGIGALSGNIIASNSGLGINLFGCTGTIIKSNIIGTSLSTQLVRGNGSHAIQLEGSRGTIIGGVHATEGNIISAGMPWGAGINFEGGGSRKSIVKGNYIGTDNTGTMAMGCDLIGIILKSDSCTIGGTAPGEGNIIVDTKKFCGLLIANANANVVTGNLIGVGLNGTPLPNERDGVLIVVENAGNTASNNIVNYNTIAYNKRNGINVGRTIDAPYFINNNEVNNDLRFNSIYCNLELGIFLNLTNAADHGNNGKIAPAINNALSTSTKVVGLPNGLASTDLVDIYEMSDCMSCDINPQGKTYIATVSPDASGNWSYEPSTPISGTLIAMATDMLRNSSQFSLCFTPCEATLNLTSSANTIMMEKDKSEVISLSANETFSVLNPEPGRLFWSIGAPDTTGSVFSSSTQVELEFMTGTAMGPGLYEVYVIAKQAGCMDTAMVSLSLFFIPNLITPNGDSINDRWSVGYSAGQFDARIYNRWGDLVYNKSDYTNEWDGSGLGDGIYYFQLENKIEPDKPLKGWIQILK